jgi:hypothetical protein
MSKVFCSWATFVFQEAPKVSGPGLLKASGPQPAKIAASKRLLDQELLPLPFLHLSHFRRGGILCSSLLLLRSPVALVPERACGPDHDVCLCFLGKEDGFPEKMRFPEKIVIFKNTRKMRKP